MKAQAAIYGTLVCLKVDDGDKALFVMGELKSLMIDEGGVYLRFKDDYYVSYELGELSIIYPSSYNNFKYWCANREEEVRRKLEIASKTGESGG